MIILDASGEACAPLLVSTKRTVSSNAHAPAIFMRSIRTEPIVLLPIV
jgi:hypothetical protein